MAPLGYFRFTRRLRALGLGRAVGSVTTDVLDFAGGTVVHINAGIAGLVAALVLRKRTGYPGTPMKPNNLDTDGGRRRDGVWVGWFGFNAGSELAADGTAGMAHGQLTQIAAATTALKPGCFQNGLATVSQALCANGFRRRRRGWWPLRQRHGFVGGDGREPGDPALTAGYGCYLARCARSSVHLGYDDSLDVFGVHAVGGIIGAMLTGVFVDTGLGGSGLGDGITIACAASANMFVGVVVTIVYCGFVSFIVLKGLEATIGLRVMDEEEEIGLDLILHDEQGYNIGL